MTIIEDDSFPIIGAECCLLIAACIAIVMFDTISFRANRWSTSRAVGL